MADPIAEMNLMIRATADHLASDINKGIRQAQSSVGAQAVALGNVISAGVLAGLGAVTAGIKRAVSLGFEGLDRIDALDEAAAKIGATYNGLQTLKFAAETTGSSMEAMVSSLAKMQGNLANGSASKAMERLGIDIASIRNLAPEQQFAEIAQKLSEIKNTGDKIDLTKQIFGRGGVDILNVINQGKAGLSEMSRTVQALGGHLTDAQRTMVTMAYGDIEALQQGWGYVKDQIAVGIAPALTAITQQVLVFAQASGGIGPMIQGWVDNMVGFTANIATAAQYASVLVSAFQSVGAAFGSAFALGQQAFNTYVAAIKAAVPVIKSAFQNIVYVIRQAATDAINEILKAVNRIPTALSSIVDTIKMGHVAMVNKVAPNASVGTGPPTAEQFDLPSSGSSGPDGGLFGLLNPPPAESGLNVDFTNLGKEIDIFKTTGADAFRVVGDAATETGDIMTDLAQGNTWGKALEENYAKAKTSAAENAAAHVTMEQQRAAALRNIEVVSAGEKASIAKSADTQVVESAKRSGEEIRRANEQTYDGFRQTGQRTITDLVTAWATGTGKISDIISQWANNMIQQFVQVSLFGNQAAGGSIGGLLSSFSGAGATGASSGGGWGKIIGSVLGGFFADGGRPPMGKVSVIGEQGPELWMPDSAGTIIPNHKARSFVGGGGGGQQQMAAPIIINQSFATGVTHADLAGMADEMEQRTTDGVLAAVGRGGQYRKGIQS